MTASNNRSPVEHCQPQRLSRVLPLLLALYQYSTLIVEALPTLKQLHVITRHGSRQPLPKDATTLEEETTETSLLTPIGQRQHYQLGAWLRERYVEDFGNILDEYSPNKVYMESSSYERTMVSANSLALGLFPAETRGPQLIPDTPPTIPIYTHARHNDITIRAYEKCPVFLDRLEALYTTKTWDMMEVDSMGLLQKLARIAVFAEYTQHNHGAYIPLKELWNVYDAIQVAKTECTNSSSAASSSVCKGLPDPSLATSIDEQDWNEIQELAHAVELLKYGRDVAKNYLGGTLWDKILQRMQFTENQVVANRFFLTSAHYPTLLGLFAALQIPFSVNEDPVIPDYASALIIEVYRDDATSERSVKILYKSGSKDEPYSVKLDDGCRTDDKDGCPMETFEGLLKNSVLTPEDWCTACQNAEADVCIKQELSKMQVSCPKNDSRIMASIFFAGMLAMAIFILFVSSFCSRRRRYNSEQNSKIVAGHLDVVDVEPSSLEPDQNENGSENGIPTEEINGERNRPSSNGEIA